jgi:hypothetical protein
MFVLKSFSPSIDFTLIHVLLGCDNIPSDRARQESKTQGQFGLWSRESLEKIKLVLLVGRLRLGSDLKEEGRLL